MEKNIYPCLWFDGNGKEAAELHLAAFGNGKITTDTAMVVMSEMSGQTFMYLNGGPTAKPNPSISFYTVCETEAELDKAWNTLSENGKVLMALSKYPWSEKYGWLQDAYGVSWQLALGKVQDYGQKYSPLFMFTGPQNGKADEAIHFYTSLFDNSAIRAVHRYEAGEGDTAGHIKHAQFTLNDYVCMAMDSTGPHAFNFNWGVSIVVPCKNQEEIDYYWDSLSGNGGKESMCGWVQDRYGVSWQIIPANMERLMKNPEAAGRVMQAVMQMKKLDMAKMQQAYDGV